MTIEFLQLMVTESKYGHALSNIITLWELRTISLLVLHITSAYSTCQQWQLHILLDQGY